MNDFRLAGRRLIATPLFTAFAVLSLAVGVGVTTAAFWAIAQCSVSGATAVVAI